MGGFNRSVRIMCKCYKRGGVFLLIAKIFYHLHRIVYNNDIPYSADVDGVYFCHNGFGTVINPQAKIGEGTYIQHSVTVGELSGNHNCPRIGKKVYIGARAMILGNVSIGDNAKIGAGAVVLTDVPANATAVGVPAKIILK